MSAGYTQRHKKYEQTPKARVRQKRYRATAAYREYDKFRNRSYRRKQQIQENAL